MLRASDLEPGRIYAHTRPLSGLANRYYTRLDDSAVRRLVKRLQARTKLDGRDLRTLHSALRGDVILQAHARRVGDDGKRVEMTSTFGVSPADDVRLRAVKHKPAYSRPDHAPASHKPSTESAAAAVM